MELTKDISAEKIPFSRECSILTDIAQETQDATGKQMLSESQLFDKVETILQGKIKKGDKHAYFQLAQFYFEQEMYDKARIYLERSKEFDYQSMYQLAVIYYDGLGACEAKPEEAVELLLKVATSDSKYSKHLLHAAQYNIGRAYFQGYGVNRQKDQESQRWWLLAADDGNPRASIKAQTALGMFYSTEDQLDLKKAFFWHSEATGNGSLESQGALGVMYEYGVGVKANSDSAYICLKGASDRGNVNASGHLVAHYYRRKLYTKAADLASRIAQLSDIETIAKETDCIPNYTAKGIAIASFYLARCLAGGHGIKANKAQAKHFYSRCYQFDEDVCANLQNVTQHGLI